VNLPNHKTKIVCTIGTATEKPRVMEQLLLAGMDVARLNFSHGSFESHRQVIENLRAASRKTGKRLAIMADLSGASIIVALLLCLSAPAAYADLSSSTYAKAREEYAKGDCSEAQLLLKKYKSEDAEFLKNNPKVLSAIKGAIDYCQYILFPCLAGTTISFTAPPPRKPDLPVNLASAFDTEARLRRVITELKSGKPNFEQMEPMLRIVVRQQMTVLVPRLQALGSLLSLSYEGQQQGSDVYEVKFTNGTTAWMIGIAPNGNISVLVYSKD